MKKLLKGGAVWQKGSFTLMDILIENGTILKIDTNLKDTYALEVDCRGVLILPALADMHVHVGEQIGGLDLADDFSTIAALADKCGLAVIGAFLTEPTASKHKKQRFTDLFQQTNDLAEKQFGKKVRWHLTPTSSSVKDIYSLLQEGCDLKFYTTYKPAGIYCSYDEIGNWMQDLKDLKSRMLVHCEDDEIVQSMSEFYPFQHPFDHTKRRPQLAEILAVERILDLAIQHNYPVHIMHVSTPQAALLVKEARKSAPVSCETAPHYLLLNETNLQKMDGHRWLCTPPLRPEASRGQLVELLQDGLFDAIATDHCPFKAYDKDLHKDNPQSVPNGLAGLGATLPLLYEQLVKPGKLPLEKLLPLLSENPAKLMNFYPKSCTIQPKADAKFILMQMQPLKEPVPVLPSLADTPNPWQDFTHTLNYLYFEDSKDAK